MWGFRTKLNCLCHLENFKDNCGLSPVSSAVFPEMCLQAQKHSSNQCLQKHWYYFQNQTILLTKTPFSSVVSCVISTCPPESHFQSFYPTQLFPIQLHEMLTVPSAINHHTQIVCQTALFCTNAAQPQHKTNLMARVWKDLQQAVLCQKTCWM